MKGYETETVYSNFPKDKITVTGSFDMELWEYEEDLSYPVWTILSESKIYWDIIARKLWPSIREENGLHGFVPISR